MPRNATSRSRRAKRVATRRTPARRQRRNEGFLRDVISVLLITAGIYALVSLVLPSDTGTLGRVLAELLRDFAGQGAFFVPLALVGIGGLLLADSPKIARGEVATGVLFLFVALVSTLHVYGVSPTQEGHPKQWAHWGGWIGALVGGGLRDTVGSVGAYLFLAAVLVFALLLIVDVPLPTLMHGLGQGASKGVGALRRVQGRRSQANGRKVRAAQKKAPFLEVSSSEKESTTEIPPNEVLEKPPTTAEEKPAEPVLPPTRVWNGSPSEAPAAPPISAAEVAPKVSEEVAATSKAPEATAEAPPTPEVVVPGPREYVLPPTTLLEYAQVLPEGPGATTDTARNIRILEETLAQFKIEAKVVEIAKGPTFTRYEIRLAPGIRVNRIESLGDNIAMNLAALDVRIQAPIPGKAAIGIEVPNKAMSMVSLREVIESPDFLEHPSPLAFALGKDVTGKAWHADLAQMPHLLIGGVTNSGKSVCLNCLIASILFRARPDQVKFMLVDPKRVELSLFDGIPHLVYPVITDVKKAAGMLNWATHEMERRYQLLHDTGTREVKSYNERAAQEGLEHLPYIVIVVDELADLMMQVAAEVEYAICRLAQLARATGIHLVIATQRPSVDVITGVIKANISSRIAFAVSSHIDSRTILDRRGAERLLGRGDMLFDPIGASKPVRIQGAYVSEREIERLVEYLRRQAEPVYTAQPVSAAAGSGGDAGAMEDVNDDLFEEAVRYVVASRRASTSSLQRKFSIGYTRAARLIDMMEERGIVSALDGSKPREVLVSHEQIEQFFRSPLHSPPKADSGGQKEAPPS